MNLFHTPNTYAGMRVISDPNCLEPTSERLFPASRHRSARVFKKLIKRHGGEFRMKPAAFRVGPNLRVHPEIYRRLKLATREVRP